MAVGGALFGGGGRAPASKALVEFRAGKMTLNSGTNLVTADKRKGLILVDQGDDQLMHFKWKDRTTGTIEDDLIILPDDVEFKRVPQCTTGRVFILKFKGAGSRKMFFWMQEPKEDKDEEYCKKVNDLLNNGPPLPGSGRSGGSSLMLGSGGLSLNNLGDTELQHLLNNMNQQQLMQIFGGSADGGGMSGLAALLGSGQGTPSSSRQRGSRSNREPPSSASSSQPAAAATTASTPVSGSAATASSDRTPANSAAPAAVPAAPKAARVRPDANASGAIQLSDLQNILSGLQVPPEAQPKGPSVDLASGLTAEAMQPLLSNPDFVKRMKELLPAEHQASNIEDEIKGTVQSPQFQQALGLFSTAFQSGQLSPLIREFALGDEAVEAASNGDLEAFVKALQKKTPKDEKTDEPEDMALD